VDFSALFYFLPAISNFSAASKRGTILLMKSNPNQDFTALFEPVPWTPRDVAWALMMAIMWVMLFVVIGGVGQRLGWTIDPGLVVVLGTLVLLIPAWYFSIYKYGLSWADLGLRGFKPATVGLGCGLMLVSLLFNLIYATLLGFFGLQIQPDIDAMFNSTKFPLTLLIGGAVVAPFVEEIFFRGFVFPGLRNRWNWQVAAVVSAGLFAMAHIIPTAILPIFILGLIFAFLYQISGSIWPSIFMHMLTNSVALSTAYAISQGWIPTP
jgi:hypothetical protein